VNRNGALKYQLISWRKGLLEKLIFAQLVKKFSAFMESKVLLKCLKDSASESYPVPVMQYKLSHHLIFKNE
jgi:hypothetical protein